MVLNVLFCAGAVPLRPEEQTTEYVQFLEQLVGELSSVFAQWVHQNPISSSTDMNFHNNRTTTGQYRHNALSPLPDVVTSANKKIHSSREDIRSRRGYEPIRFRLDSVGSAVSSGSTPCQSPMNFDLITPSSSAASNGCFFTDVPSWPADDPLTSTSETEATTPSPPSHDSSSQGNWRQIGRDLRGIADTFATSRRSTQESNGPNWNFLSALAPFSSPLLSALLVYLWWKIVRRWP